MSSNMFLNNLHLQSLSPVFRAHHLLSFFRQIYHPLFLKISIVKRFFEKLKINAPEIPGTIGIGQSREFNILCNYLLILTIYTDYLHYPW